METAATLERVWFSMTSLFIDDRTSLKKKGWEVRSVM
jgi:hypothetical protein